jgi:hypothetical protein
MIFCTNIDDNKGYPIISVLFHKTKYIDFMNNNYSVYAIGITLIVICL